MANCVISTVSFGIRAGNQLIIYKMSPSNVLPSAPPDQLYPKLPPDNFRLSRIGDIQNKFRKKTKTIEMSPKNTKKAQTATHYVAVGLGSLSAALSAFAIALSLTVPGIIVDAPFCAVGAFCGAGYAGLTLASARNSA